MSMVYSAPSCSHGLDFADWRVFQSVNNCLEEWQRSHQPTPKTPTDPKGVTPAGLPARPGQAEYGTAVWGGCFLGGAAFRALHTGKGSTVGALGVPGQLGVYTLSGRGRERGVPLSVGEGGSEGRGGIPSGMGANSWELQEDNLCEFWGVIFYCIEN